MDKETLYDYCAANNVSQVALNRKHWDQQCLYSACCGDAVDAVKLLTETLPVDGHSVATAAAYGSLSSLTYLLEKNSSVDINNAIEAACASDELDTFKFLMLRDNHRDIRQLFLASLDSPNVAKYLMDNYDVVFTPNMLHEAVELGSVEVMKLLWPHFDPHHLDDYVFKLACCYHDDGLTLLKSLIFDLNIEQTGEITQYLKRTPKPLHQNVLTMFQARDDQKILNQHLEQSNVASKTKKI